MQRRASLFLLASFVAVAALGCAKDSEATPKAGELKTLTVDQVAAKIAAKDGKTFVFDNNPKEIWVKSHVPGAKWLEEDKVTAAELPADKTALLIFYCHDET
jgi:hypothetical protein